MYILSALFKDTRIGESVLEYAERALMTAINGFDSVFWNVRNASTLLFSSLVNRIFGVNRSKEEISKKNRFSIKLNLVKFKFFKFIKLIYLIKYGWKDLFLQISSLVSVLLSSYFGL